MYTLVSAIAKPVSVQNGDLRWITVDISQIPLVTLYTQYRKVIATLSNPVLPNPVSLDLSLIQQQVGGENITFSQYLTQIGEATLPTSTNLPVLNPQYVRYNDAFRAGYEVTPIMLGTSVTSIHPPRDKTSLQLTKADISYSDFYAHCMVSVNGFFHLIDADTEAAYVIDGMKSQMQSGENKIGIYSFKALGNLTYIPITTQMIYKQSSTQVYQDQCYIDTGVDITNKTVLLVIGGYLHLLDSRALFKVSDKSICIRFQYLPLLERYYESKKYIDLSPLPLTKAPFNDQQVSIQEFYSDANLIAYLTLSQSFIVLLDNPDTFVETEQIHVTKLPNMFISYEKPEYPLITGYGKVSEYWHTYEDKQYSVTCKDSLKANFLFDTNDSSIQVSVDNKLISSRPFRQSDAYYLKIGVDF